MKIVIVYNKHRHGGGSDVVAQSTIDLLDSMPDVEVVSFIRDSRELNGVAGKIKATVSGCYSAEAVKAFSRLIETEKPDIVHAHEVYPLISPWIFKVCVEKNIPVVMTCHDYRLSCPIATYFRHGSVCYECSEHNEFRCLWHNCCGSFAKSATYAARNYIGRKKRLFLDNVDLFLTPSEKTKDLLCRYAGLPVDKVVAVGNPIPVASEPCRGERPETENNGDFIYGDYVAYAGRFEPEKGFDLLLEALEGTGIPLKVAGDASEYLALGKSLSRNVEFAGHLNHDSMGLFYQQARMVVVPSICHETFGLVVAEALSCGTPVVVSDLGALAEVAGSGGLVVSAGDIIALREAISRLWNDEKLCRTMAEDGREHVKQYSDQAYVENLMGGYGKVLSTRCQAAGN